MFENPRRGKQARNFVTNVPKILDLKSSSEQIFSRKLSLGVPADSIKGTGNLSNEDGEGDDNVTYSVNPRSLNLSTFSEFFWS